MWWKRRDTWKDTWGVLLVGFLGAGIVRYLFDLVIFKLADVREALAVGLSVGVALLLVELWRKD